MKFNTEKIKKAPALEGAFLFEKNRNNLLVSLVAKKTAVFWWMFFRQGSYAVWRVTLFTEFFRFLFIHLHEFGMVVIVGKELGCFFRGFQEKEKKATADNYKQQVVDDYVFSFCFLFICIH